MYDLNVLALLAFLPGPMLLHMFSKTKYNTSLSLPELILAGSIIWNFVLIVPSFLFGLFNIRFDYYFVLFTFASMAISLLWLILVVFGKLRIHSVYAFSLSIRAFVPFLLGFFALMITLYHPLYNEWDAVSIYLPAGKSIALTGRLYDLYHVSNLTVFVNPGPNILYAWLFYITKADYFRLLPYIFFMLNCLTVYLFSTRISGKDSGFIALVVLFSLPSTLRILGRNSLYGDLPFVFYSTASIFFAIKAGRENGTFYYALAGLATSLAVLSHSFGFVVASFILSLFALYSRLKFHRIISTVISSSVFSFFFLWDITHFSPFSFEFVEAFIRELSIVILSILFFLFTNFGAARISLEARLKNILVFILGVSPIAFFVICTWLRFGVIETWGPGVAEADQILYLVQPPVTQSQLTDYFRWYALFFSIGLGATYLIPSVIGLLRVVYKSLYENDHSYSVVLLWFIVFLMMWSFIGCPFQVHESRRLYLFAPIFSILVAEGVYAFSTLLMLDRKYVTWAFLLFNMIASIYLWRFHYGNDVVFNIFTNPTISDIADVSYFYITSSLFMLIFFWIHVIESNSWQISKYIKSIMRVCSLLLIVAELTFLYLIMMPMINYVNAIGWSPSIYNQMTYPPKENIFEVIAFYKQNINDNYTTVSFFAWYLSYYANRSLIDLTNQFGWKSLLPFLKCNNSEELIDKLLTANIRYFLIPTSRYNDFYKMYQESLNHFLFFREIKMTPFFILVREFYQYQLYKLLSPREYQETMFREYGSVMLLSDDNQTEFYNIRSETVKLSNNNLTKLKGINSLTIQISMSSVIESPVIEHQFSVPQNLTLYNYCSFYWYGSNSNARIHVRFFTEDWTNQFFYEFTDNWTGWARFVIPLHEFKVLIGSPRWDHITRFGFAIVSYSHDVNFILDRVSLMSEWMDVHQTRFLIVKTKLEN